MVERIQGLAARGVGLMPDRLKLLAAGGRPVTIDGETLDPEIQLILRMMRIRGSATFVRADAGDAARERRRTVSDARIAQGPRTPVAEVRTLEVPGERGVLPARHYLPPPIRGVAARATEVALVVYVHGGGWVLGDLDTHDELCRLICRHAGCQVLALDYPLAPEHPFPEPVEEVTAAARWALAHAGDLGADPRRVALAGDSAGGNLAAVACQLLARREGPQPMLQVLIYPGTDFARRYPSEELFAEGFYLDQPSRDWCTDRYVPPEVDRRDPRLSPLHGELSGLPAAIVLTAAFDPLRDEGEAYAEALRQGGVEVVMRRASGMIHGFMSMTGISRAARDEALRLAGMIRSRLGS